jgi:hypothetical protein
MVSQRWVEDATKELEFSRSPQGPTGGFPNEGDISTLVPARWGSLQATPAITLQYYRRPRIISAAENMTETTRLGLQVFPRRSST